MTRYLLRTKISLPLPIGSAVGGMLGGMLGGMVARVIAGLIVVSGVAACGASDRHVEFAAALDDPQAEADALLSFYNPIYVGLRNEASLAWWSASTDVSDHNTGLRTGADTAFSAFVGNAELIRRARALLERRGELSVLTQRQLEALLYEAASAPQSNPELSRRRIAAESEQSARLDGFEFCLFREAGVCTRPATTNDIDRILRESTDPGERQQAWEASKEIGAALHGGLVELVGLRNAVAREMGYADFFAFQVANYGMTPDEMMAMLDRLLEEIAPLYQELQCWARHELAERYRAQNLSWPDRVAPGYERFIPAHLVGNRWGQSWPGLVEGVNRDGLVADREPEWVVRQAERFYVSMGFSPLPDSFYERSDLFPVGPGESRRKNDHASAWHIDLGLDVRSLMSVEPVWEWFGTTHHELGHVYYFLAYARDEVPPLLRAGANRSFHEAMGTLIEVAAGQGPYLSAVGLASEGQSEEERLRTLLDSALTGPVVFLPFAAGTMSHFEKALYSDGLDPSEYQERWWELTARYQGVMPAGNRLGEGCDACTKTHINDDPAQYYDYALAEVLVYQLHDHICRQILHQDPHACSYYERPEVGAFLRSLMEPGATRDWQALLREHLGGELSAEPMLRYFEPLIPYLREQNRGRSCGW